jgi:hypothetical protein
MVMASLPTSIEASDLSAAIRLFSPSTMRELAAKGRSPLVARLVADLSLTASLPDSAPLGDLFDLAFAFLKQRQFRHEYIYKAAITHKVLLGVHSLHTSVMLTEFRVGCSKADVAILNGTSTVYEIKSERDKLDRLEAQISAYRKVFARVNVITGEKHFNIVSQIIPKDVGILLLTDNFHISTIRDAKEDLSRVVPVAIFESIQSHEAKRLLAQLNVAIPAVPNTEMHCALRERFSELEPAMAHNAMVRVLKETRSLLSLSELINGLPSSLKAAALSARIRKKDHSRLLNAIGTPIAAAVRWART